jgi:hypothetical protein
MAAKITDTFLSKERFSRFSFFAEKKRIFFLLYREKLMY